MKRILQRTVQVNQYPRFCFAESGGKQKPESPSQSPKQQKQQEYLLFPTKFPIFPYYVYTTKLNKHYYQYLTRNNIKYVVTFPIQPGVSKKVLRPYSRSHLQKQLGLYPTTVAASGEKDKVKVQQSLDTIEISNNNLIFDGPTSEMDDVPVHYVDKVQQIYPTGSICRIAAHVIVEGQYMAHLRSQIRLQIDPNRYVNQEGPLMYISGKTLKNDNVMDVGNDYNILVGQYQKMKQISRINLPQVANSSIIKTIQLLSGYLCTLSYFTPMQVYALFRITNMSHRVKILIQYYQTYTQLLQQSWHKFNQTTNAKVDMEQKRQTVQGLVDQVKGALGYQGQSKFVSKIKKKLETRKYPENVLKLIECELDNLGELGDGHPDINRKKHFINLLVNYPFGVRSQEIFDIDKAREILQEDHYGMKKIKQRILQFIAVSKLKGQFKSKVLLLYGPPGVGKTSIVKSIAKCLNRPYGRISLGGEYDTSLMKGHRKTYIGAYPGKIFDSISKLKTQNPVILLDEIDKIQTRGHGASLQDCVMEILDPVQNYKFKDDFVDVQIDLSNVLFICTANTLQTIFPPLLDRLQRIQVTGYTTHEKQQIFKRYIQKQCMQQNGLPQDLQKQIVFPQQSISFLIQGYCKQAGVRNLVRKCNNIFQKMALQYVQGKQFIKRIGKDEICKYIGLPRFYEGRLYAQIPPKGVMVGLAYNAYGGSIMYIECASSNPPVQIDNQSQGESSYSHPPTQNPGSGSLIVTGNIQEVMKESCQLAYSYAKYITSAFFNNSFLELNDVHLNFPQIQIGKDGPSAGAAITCSLISLALDKPAHQEIAMTGEISLSGKISAIGGVKEKTMGAKREGITNLIFPQDNRKDIEELEDEIKKGMTFHFADHFFQVMELVFGIKV